jgi:hypothetical protein
MTIRSRRAAGVGRALGSADREFDQDGQALAEDIAERAAVSRQRPLVRGGATANVAAALFRTASRILARGGLL